VEVDGGGPNLTIARQGVGGENARYHARSASGPTWWYIDFSTTPLVVCGIARPLDMR